MNSKNSSIDSYNTPLEDIFLGTEINNSKKNLSNKSDGENNPKLDKPGSSDNNHIKYINRPVMDTSLPYIPVYTHLVTYDLTPIERPPTPPVIKILRAQLRNDTPESRASSKTGQF
ncbi:uncharacterized protein LOC123259212 [Cotesia glomerata]|uniref:uncharacterized protein LOC123259212 n=1 Tax=Cotesia glomerata TaxID=32391 RepID=UPI001D0024E5|nr:uncharacterized protein LOC123259212 [Cotesia glomerata]